MTFIRSLIATVFFVVLLLSIYYAHIAFFSVNVIFYAAIVDAILATIVTGVLLYLASYFAPLSSLEKAQLLAICLLGGYAFAISVPTVIDRSLSFYILEKLQQRGGGIRADSFADVFTKEYMHEYRLVDVRLTEQEESGTVVIKNGCAMLTPKGKMIASISSYFRHHLLPKKRLLRGEYTDALTDPFRDSIETPPYTCR
ncbi:MAG: hypothetical protein KDJ47_09930 [Hyphomicrobiaceae bacterium]|nr:hypothetical protein [Hyphomicrobiaceae bacterium]